ncbi:MAG: hypothetical protein WC455_25955 [Dehalococcoidia bacterium]|jgi:hypothetical protein
MNNPNVQSKVLSRAQACEALGGIAINTLDRRIADGTLASIRFGRRVFIPIEEIDRLVSSARIA